MHGLFTIEDIFFLLYLMPDLRWMANVGESECLLRSRGSLSVPFEWAFFLGGTSLLLQLAVRGSQPLSLAQFHCINLASLQILSVFHLMLVPISGSVCTPDHSWEQVLKDVNRGLWAVGLHFFLLRNHGSWNPGGETGVEHLCACQLLPLGVENRNCFGKPEPRPGLSSSCPWPAPNSPPSSQAPPRQSGARNPHPAPPKLSWSRECASTF